LIVLWFFVRIDGRDVKVDIPSTVTSATDSSSSAKTEPVDIDKPLQPTAFTQALSSPARHDCDTVTVSSPARHDSDTVSVSGQCRQSYASVVSPRRNGPHDNVVDDVELPYPGELSYLAQVSRVTLPRLSTCAGGLSYLTQVS